jgi:ABC-type sulfate/molybdate transport systems ATPase subunit
MKDTAIELTRRKLEQLGVEWVYLVHDMEECEAVAKPVMELETGQSSESFLPSRGLCPSQERSCSINLAISDVSLHVNRREIQ